MDRMERVCRTGSREHEVLIVATDAFWDIGIEQEAVRAEHEEVTGVGVPIGFGADDGAMGKKVHRGSLLHGRRGGRGNRLRRRGRVCACERTRTSSRLILVRCLESDPRHLERELSPVHNNRINRHPLNNEAWGRSNARMRETPVPNSTEYWGVCSFPQPGTKRGEGESAELTGLASSAIAILSSG